MQVWFNRDRHVNHTCGGTLPRGSGGDSSRGEDAIYRRRLIGGDCVVEAAVALEVVAFIVRNKYINKY